MKREDARSRQISDQMGREKKQIKEFCSWERRKLCRIANGSILQSKGRLRKTMQTAEQLQNNDLVTIDVKVKLLQNFLSKYGS